MSLHADFATRAWEAGGCAPLVVAGPALDAARHKLRAWPQPGARERKNPAQLGRRPKLRRFNAPVQYIGTNGGDAVSSLR
jgi:hypothetical protein